jgi:hypothetical protein
MRETVHERIRNQPHEKGSNNPSDKIANRAIELSGGQLWRIPPLLNGTIRS